MLNIYCAKCHHQIERFECTYLPDIKAQQIIAYCHGSTEKILIIEPKDANSIIVMDLEDVGTERFQAQAFTYETGVNQQWHKEELLKPSQPEKKDLKAKSGVSLSVKNVKPQKDIGCSVN